MASTPKLVWLITGSSAGIGLALTRYVLTQGHKVIATSRTPSRTPDLVTEIEQSGGKWLPLDLTSESLEEDVKHTEQVFGKIDVIVNCAGFALMGAVEDIPMSRIVAQMETNFYGPVRVIKMLLPMMRKRRSGIIINVSSAQTFTPVASTSMYGASKAALDVYTESLQQEVRGFGIKVLLVRPGAFRTNFATSGSVKVPLSEEYANEDHPVSKQLAWMDTLPRLAKGSPDLGAKVIFDAAVGDHDQLHLLIGNSCWQAAKMHRDRLSQILDTQKEIAASADKE